MRGSTRDDIEVFYIVSDGGAHWLVGLLTSLAALHGLGRQDKL